MSEKLGLFRGEDKPTPEIVWGFYEKGLVFNNAVNLDETVKSNENFFIGKQWEGVQSNGLPTPVFNIIKRVVCFTVATITSDNIKCNATALPNTPRTDDLVEPVRVVNEELDALTEHNNVSALMRSFCRNAAVDGDGCVYTYWDPDVDCGGGVKGAIKSEIIENTRVLFGNPNDRAVQTQPYIIIANREMIRNVKMRAKSYNAPDWESIKPDYPEDNSTDSVKYTDDKVTVLLTLWRDDETGEIWAYESCQNCEVRKPWSLGIRLYPLIWLNWDYIQDCYHGQAMITGLIPNQIFINKAWAMSMLSIMRSAWPKVIYDKTRVAKWDNRPGGAIPSVGDPTTVATIMDPAAISPQVSQLIQLAVDQTEQSLGATAVALGDTRPDNTSAIIALQRAAATPSEMTKQNLYNALEDLFRIYLEFMGVYYGSRMVDIETPDGVADALSFAGVDVPQTTLMEFDFSILHDMPFMLKLDVGGSTYYSEIAAMQTLDQLRQAQEITTLQYLERIPDSYMPGRRALIAEIKQQQAQQQAMMMGMQGMGNTPPVPEEGEPITGPLEAMEEPEVKGGRGYGALQRAINNGTA